MSDNPFAGKFDVRNFGGVIREIMIFRMNQMGRVNTANHFWKAQQESVALRKKLERAYNSELERQRLSKTDSVNVAVTELWMLGIAAYVLICQEGRRLDDVIKMSGPKLVKKAIEVSKPIIETSQPMLDEWIAADRPDDEAHIWQMPYFWDKEFMPEDK